MDDHGDRRGPGRPPVLDPEQRRRRILDAAEALFVERGFSRTNMDQIARACSMSKQTVYSLFASKEALFAALVDEALPPLPDLTADATRGLEEELIDLLEAVAHHALSPRHIAMTRLVVEEARDAPQLRRNFYERVVARGRILIARRLNDLATRHGVDFGADPLRVSDILFGAVIGGAMVHALIGDLDAAAWDSTAQRIRAIARFLTKA